MSKLTTIMFNLTPDEDAEENISRLTQEQAEAIELICLRDFLHRVKQVLIFETKGSAHAGSTDSISRRDAVDDIMNEFLELNVH